MCWNLSPWAISDNLAAGFVSASAENFACGRCFQLQFSGADVNNGPAALPLAGKTMIVQVVSHGGADTSDEFDLLIPGGGTGVYGACSAQWGTGNLGAQYGGFLAECSGDKGCVQKKCEQIFAGKEDLRAGCDWFATGSMVPMLLSSSTSRLRAPRL